MGNKLFWSNIKLTSSDILADYLLKSYTGNNNRSNSYIFVTISFMKFTNFLQSKGFLSFIRYFGIFTAYYLAYGFITNDRRWLSLIAFVVAFLIGALLPKRGSFSTRLKEYFQINGFFVLVFLFVSSYAGFNFTRYFLIGVPLYTGLGFWFNQKQQWLIPTISGVLAIIFSSCGFTNLYMYFHDPSPYQNRDFEKIQLIDVNLDTVVVDTRGIAVIDFYNRACSECFKKFPDYERIYDEFRNHKGVKFYSVIVPVRNDSMEVSINIVDSLDYSFPKYYALSKDQPNSLGFNTYPHLLILKDGKLRYSGWLVVEKGLIAFNLRNEIRRLLYE